MVTLVTYCVRLSIATLMILEVAFHAGNEGLALNSSSIAFFTLIIFRGALDVIVFVIFLLLLLFIACFTAPHVSLFG